MFNSYFAKHYCPAIHEVWPMHKALQQNLRLRKIIAARAGWERLIHFLIYLFLKELLNIYKKQFQ